MEQRLRDLRSKSNPKARIKIMEGHFATTHSHINMYIDMSTVKCRHNNARETAKELASRYVSNTSVDTIICMDGTEVIGAFMAEVLADTSVYSMNTGKNISVVTPEFNQMGQMIFRDNTQRMIANQQVLLRRQVRQLTELLSVLNITKGRYVVLQLFSVQQKNPTA